MEILIIFLFGSFLGFNVPVTQVHQDCVKGKKEACVVEKKINPYVR